MKFTLKIISFNCIESARPTPCLYCNEKDNDERSVEIRYGLYICAAEVNILAETVELAFKSTLCFVISGKMSAVKNEENTNKRLERIFIRTQKIFVMKIETMIFMRVPKLRKATVRFFMSVRLSAWNNFATSGRIVTKFDI